MARNRPRPWLACLAAFAAACGTSERAETTACRGEGIENLRCRAERVEDPEARAALDALIEANPSLAEAR